MLTRPHADHGFAALRLPIPPKHPITYGVAEPIDDLIPTRASLIQRLKDWQDEASWQVFFDTYWRLIHRVALKRGLTEAEAQDVVQETMLVVAKRMPHFRYDPAIGSFKCWLLKTTRWRIADQYRKRAPVTEPIGRRDSITPTYAADDVSLDALEDDSDLLGAVEDPNSPDWEVLWEEEWRANLFAVALANVKRRADPLNYQVFDFYVNKERPPETVAKIFGIPVNQVYLAKHRISEMMKDEVQRLETGMI